MPNDALESSPAIKADAGNDYGLAEMARRHGVSPQTFVKWIKIGRLLPDGTRLRLQAKRLGGRWRVSDDAVARFAEAGTEAWSNGASC